MQSTTLLASIAMLAALIGSPVLAEGGKHQRDHDRQRVTQAGRGGSSDQGMRAIANDSSPQQPSHGWQYFSDPVALRAVVISPQGDYYFSRGKGMRWVAGAQAGA